MRKALLRTESEIAQLYEKYVDMVYRICFSFLKTQADTEDAVQNTFLRLIRSNPLFETEEHEKAWLIVTASNICRDQLRHWWRKREPLEDHRELSSPPLPEIDETLEAVLSLPEKYKTAIYLYYYEGYLSEEIASMLKKPSSTIRTYLQKGRELLRAKLGGDWE